VPTPQPAPQRPTSRYGARARGESSRAAGASPRPGAASSIGGKIVVIGAVIFVVLIAVAYGRNVMERRSIPVKANFVSQEAVDDHTTRLWVDVTRKDPSVPSYCIVTALNYEFAEVGRREVVLPAGGDELTRVSTELPVREPAVSGRVYGCSEDIPFYMDTSAAHNEAR